MNTHERSFSTVAGLITQPDELSISGLQAAALRTIDRLRRLGHCVDLVCGFDDQANLLGLMLEDPDDRQVFQSLCFEYGFCVSFHDRFNCMIRVWIGDHLDWIGTDKQARSLVSA